MSRCFSRGVVESDKDWKDPRCDRCLGRQRSPRTDGKERDCTRGASIAGIVDGDELAGRIDGDTRRRETRCNRRAGDRCCAGHARSEREAVELAIDRCWCSGWVASVQNVEVLACGLDRDVEDRIGTGNGGRCAQRRQHASCPDGVARNSAVAVVGHVEMSSRWIQRRKFWSATSGDGGASGERSQSSGRLTNLIRTDSVAAIVGGIQILSRMIDDQVQRTIQVGCERRARYRSERAIGWANRESVDGRWFHSRTCRTVIHDVEEPAVGVYNAVVGIPTAADQGGLAGITRHPRSDVVEVDVAERVEHIHVLAIGVEDGLYYAVCPNSDRSSIRRQIRAGGCVYGVYADGAIIDV